MTSSKSVNRKNFIQHTWNLIDTDINLRVKIVIFTFFAIFFLLGLRLLYLCNIGLATRISDSLKRFRSVDIIAPRQEIVDRNGKIIAQNLKVYDFYLIPSKMIDIKGNLKKINNILKLHRDENLLLQTLYAKRKIPNANVLIKIGITEAEKKKLLDNGVLGLSFIESERRFYPYGAATSFITGYTSEGKGISGIEKEMNSYLSNKHNAPLESSIDVDIQAIVYDILKAKMDAVNSKAAVGIIMKIDTGEVISAVSLPSCDLNNISSCSNDQLYNRFSLGVYELGSVFKLLLAALAFENNISPYKKYKREEYKINDYVIHDIDNKQSLGGEMNIMDILRVSSNVGCAKVIEDIGYEKQKPFFKQLGLLNKLDMEIAERGNVIFQKRWSLINAVTMSYGHGIAVTPMHFVNAISAILRERFMYPTFLKYEGEDKKLDFVVNHRTSELLKHVMREVVDSGSGKHAQVRKYDIGGKSGTAIKQSNGVYDKYKMSLSFVAALPMSKPEYVFFVMLDEPKVDASNNYMMRAGLVAGSLMSQIISIIGPMLKIPTLY